MTVFFGLGVTGRLGNQIIQYCIIRHLEKTHGISIYHSRWIGETFFQLDKVPDAVDHLVIKEISVDDDSFRYDKILKLKNECMPEEIKPCKHTFIKNGTSEIFLSKGFDIQNKVLFHYPRVNLSLLKSSESFLRSILQFKPALQNIAYQTKHRVFGNNKLVVIHVRKGDFNLMVNPYFMFITRLYTDWISNNLDGSKKLYVCGQPSQRIKKKFAKFRPVYFEDILNQNPSIQASHSYLDIIIDQVLMRLEDELLISNSSFSFTSCMFSLNKNARFFKPNLEQGKLIEFSPWDSASYDVCPFGFRFLKLYLKYRPRFGLSFIYQIIKMTLKGQKIRDLSY